MSRIKTWIKQINFVKLKNKSLDYTSDLALRSLKFQFSITAPILDLLLRARGIDTSADPKKIAFDRLRANMLWCIDNPRHVDEQSHITADLTGVLTDVYIEPITRVRSTQTAGKSLFSGEDAVKKVQEYIIANNKNVKSAKPIAAEVIEVSAVRKQRKKRGAKSRKSK